MRFIITTHLAFDDQPLTTVVDWPEIADLPTARIRARQVIADRNAKLLPGARQWVLGGVDFHDASVSEAFGEGYTARRAGLMIELHCPYSGQEHPSLAGHESNWKKGWKAHEHDCNRRRQRTSEQAPA